MEEIVKRQAVSQRVSHLQAESGFDELGRYANSERLTPYMIANSLALTIGIFAKVSKEKPT